MGVLIGAMLETAEAGESLDAQRRRLLLAAIAKGGTTRKRLASSFGFRLATISRHIAELNALGLVRDGESLVASGPGRPEVVLELVSDAVVTVVIRMVSDTFVGALVDLGGNVLEEAVHPVHAAKIDARGIEKAIVGMAEALPAHAPEARVAGLSLSLPGIIEGPGMRWSFSGRFPKVASVRLGHLPGRLAMPVMVHRPLNAELRARLMARADEREGAVVLLHWGFGISLSYAVEGRIIHSDPGAFGEIGHWQIGDEDAKGALCRCGKRGCLETRAALWSLGVRLGFPDMAEDAFGEVIRRNARLASHPLMLEAGEAMARALRDVYLLLFPQRLVISGPFVQSPQVLSRLKKHFHASLPSHVPGSVSISSTALSAADERIGAARPLLQRALRGRLAAVGEG